MKYGIKDEYWKKLCELFSKKPKIEKVILYGSRAKGTYKLHFKPQQLSILVFQ